MCIILYLYSRKNYRNDHPLSTYLPVQLLWTPDKTTLSSFYISTSAVKKALANNHTVPIYPLMKGPEMPVS